MATLEVVMGSIRNKDVFNITHYILQIHKVIKSNIH
jgi:hypothetical protein